MIKWVLVLLLIFVPKFCLASNLVSTFWVWSSSYSIDLANTNISPLGTFKDRHPAKLTRIVPVNEYGFIVSISTTTSTENNVIKNLISQGKVVHLRREFSYETFDRRLGGNVLNFKSETVNGLPQEFYGAVAVEISTP